MPLGIIELLQRVGEQRVQVQNLLNSLTHASINKRNVTTLSFSTQAITPSHIAAGDHNIVGLVLWLPRDIVERIHREYVKTAAEG